MPLSTDLETGKTVADHLSMLGATYEHPGYVAVPLNDGTGTHIAIGQHNWTDANVCDETGDCLYNIEIPEPHTVRRAVLALIALRERLHNG